MAKPILQILGLQVAAKDKLIIEKVDLSLFPGEIQFLVGPNGSGKSTLALAMAGSPNYQTLSGQIKIGGRDVTKLSANRRARLGLFVAFQNPPSVEGITLLQMLRAAQSSNQQSIFDFRDELIKRGQSIGFMPELIERDVNSNLSGGEKKRSEIMQLLTLRPKVAIFDEIDSGLDQEGLARIARQIRILSKQGMAALVITHSDRLLRFLKPSRVYKLDSGKIIHK